MTALQETERAPASDQNRLQDIERGSLKAVHAIVVRPNRIGGLGSSIAHCLLDNNGVIAHIGAVLSAGEASGQDSRNGWKASVRLRRVTANSRKLV